VLILKKIVGSEQRAVGSGNAEEKHAARLKVAGEDGEIADKGRRSFLRRGEGQGECNAEGTPCQCLFKRYSNGCETCWKDVVCGSIEGKPASVKPPAIRAWVFLSPGFRRGRMAWCR
jgi:hypothetical protein